MLCLLLLRFLVAPLEFREGDEGTRRRVSKLLEALNIKTDRPKTTKATTEREADDRSHESQVSNLGSERSGEDLLPYSVELDAAQLESLDKRVKAMDSEDIPATLVEGFSLSRHNILAVTKGLTEHSTQNQ